MSTPLRASCSFFRQKNTLRLLNLHKPQRFSLHIILYAHRHRMVHKKPMHPSTTLKTPKNALHIAKNAPKQSKKGLVFPFKGRRKEKTAVCVLVPPRGCARGKKDREVFQGEWVGEANHGNAVHIIKAERFAYHPFRSNGISSLQKQLYSLRLMIYA